MFFFFFLGGGGGICIAYVQTHTLQTYIRENIYKKHIYVYMQIYICINIYPVYVYIFPTVAMRMYRLIIAIDSIGQLSDCSCMSL